MKNFLLILFSVSLAVLGQVFLKKGMLEVGEVQLSVTIPVFLIRKIFSNFKLFLGFTFFGVSSFVWLVILSKVPLSLAYPMVSVGYVLTVIISWQLLGETVPPLRWLALVVICSGVVLLSRS